jgi:DNA recombination protein RmuC
LLNEIQQLKSLNVQMSEEATNLTRALKGDNKAQGHWGEVVLERVLERSGLRKDQEYEVQKVLVDAQGKRQIPDVIVRLPENKDIVIDAKVSLVHYEAYANAETLQEQQASLKQFKKSLRQHLEGLAKRHYEHLPELRSLDFVFLFMPIETAFLVALEQDPQLFAEAYEKNIILVSPSTLLATLRTVQSIWRYERQNRNAEQMAEVAGGLFDQCVRVIETLQGLGKQLQRAHETYDKAMGQLNSGRGNLVRRVEQLESLGARVKKSLPTHMQSDSGGTKSPDDTPKIISAETAGNAGQESLLEDVADSGVAMKSLGTTESLK